MDTVLSFFSDLILFTAGLAVGGLWLIIIMVVSVEAWDLISEKVFGRKPKGLLAPKECDCPAHEWRSRECTCVCDHAKEA